MRLVETSRRTRLSASLLGEACLSTEDARLAPATILVMGLSWLASPAQAANFNVASDGDLRSAISTAGNGDTITFTANITLASNLPTVTKNLTFVGGNHILSGGNQYRGLFVASGTVAINDLTIAYAKAQGGNGGSSRNGGGGAGGGGAGLGGALFVGSVANVTVSNVNLRSNLAQGGNGGGTNGFPSSFGSSGGGGGYWPTGADGGNGGFTESGNGGQGGGGDGSIHSGTNGGFGGGGGGGNSGAGGAGGFGGGAGGSGSGIIQSGGWGGGGTEGDRTGGAGGGAGLGGAIFVQEGGTLNLAGPFDISGNTVAGGVGWSSKNGLGVGSGIFLQGNGTLTPTPGAGQKQTISDAIVDQTGVSGSGGSWSLVKNGAGTTVLTGTNAYSGGTTVNAGILQGNASGLRGNILNNASVVFDQTGSATYAGDMSGTGSLTKTGGGTLTLSGTNTYSGGTTVSAGFLLFSSDANLGAAGAGITLNGGLIRYTNTAAAASISRPVTLAGEGGISVDQDSSNRGALTWTGNIGGTGQFIKAGSGGLELAGNNTYSGGTVVSEGVLSFTSDANLGAAGTGITLTGGYNGFLSTTKDAAAGLSINRPLVTLISRNHVAVAGISVDLNPLTWSGNISGDGVLVKHGAGILQLTGTNTYTGGTVVWSGTLQVASDGTLGAAGTAVTLANNGSLWATETFTTARPFTLTNPGGMFQLETGTTLTLTGTITGGTIGLVGTGTLVLAGTSSYNGINNYGGTVQGNTATLLGNIFFDTNAGNTNARSVIFDQATDGTFAGTITGIGSLTKTGTGKLILSGDNNYSTGTTVAAGTLQGTSRSLQGAIVNNAALIFDQAFDGTYAGAMSGTGTLTKNGSGNLNLTGTSSVGGGTTINAGGFAVNGHLASNVTLNKGGTLSGTGNIDGHITNNGGTIKPGNSIGHLVVNGNLTLNSGTLEIEVNAQGDSDRISVVGAGHKVMIHAGTLLIAPEAGTYTPGTRYTIITAEGGGNVTFGDVAGGVGFLTPQVSLDREHIYVTLALQPDAFRSAGLTRNQQAVGGALDAIAATGDVGGLVTAMANVPMAYGAAALQTLSGQPYADFGTVNVRASQLFMNAVGHQMAVARGAGTGLGNRAALAAPGFSTWLSGIESTGNVRGGANASGLDYSLGGAAFGIDYRVDPHFLLGVAGGYISGSQSVNGFAGKGDTDTVSVVAYGSFAEGAFYADALAGYAKASNSLQRIISSPGLPTGIAKGDADANQFLGQIETGYKINLHTPFKTSITPFGRLQVASNDQDGFTESGSSFYNLAVRSQSTTSVRTAFGADFSASFGLGNGMPLDLGLRLGWVHEFADTTPSITAAFAAAAGPGFTVSGATPRRDSALIGFSAAARISDSSSLFVSYDGEVGGGNDNHQLRGGVRLTW